LKGNAKSSMDRARAGIKEKADLFRGATDAGQLLDFGSINLFTGSGHRNEKGGAEVFRPREPVQHYDPALPVVADTLSL
jgi:hypothetical protein